jgi:hypothetical protein
MGHRVTVLVLPGVLPLEFGIAVQIFGTDQHYELTMCAAGRARRRVLCHCLGWPGRAGRR